MINKTRSINIKAKCKKSQKMVATVKSTIQIATQALDDKKGIDIMIIPLSKNNGMADSLIIATGTSKTHVKSLADNVSDKLKENGCNPHIEGVPENTWVLVDIGDIVVHIFQHEARGLYNLEKLWGFDGDEDEGIAV